MLVSIHTTSSSYFFSRSDVQPPGGRCRPYKQKQKQNIRTPGDIAGPLAHPVPCPCLAASVTSKRQLAGMITPPKLQAALHTCEKVASAPCPKSCLCYCPDIGPLAVLAKHHLTPIVTSARSLLATALPCMGRGRVSPKETYIQNNTAFNADTTAAWFRPDAVQRLMKPVPVWFRPLGRPTDYKPESGGNPGQTGPSSISKLGQNSPPS